ncbi:CGNR zinc finger domain-containing protein [Streptomyces sp. cg36]
MQGQPADDNRPRGLHFLVELVNTVQQDATATAQELQGVVDRHGGPDLGLTEATGRELREAIAPLARILDTDDTDRAAEAINALLDRHPSRPRLVRLPERPWALHSQTPPGADPAHWLLSTCALALALWLSERGHCAWGRCAAPGCDRHFIDTGRKSPQRYCSTRCGTRVRVAAHRAQRRS